MVQTGLDVGLHYHWPAGLSALSVEQYGFAFVNPASVAATVVSADALECKSQRIQHVCSILH